VKSPLKILPGGARRVREKEQLSSFWPIRAAPGDRAFSEDDWIFERKLAGKRCPGFVSDGDFHLLSRNCERLNDTYPEIEDVHSDAAASQPSITLFPEKTPGMGMHGKRRTHAQAELTRGQRIFPDRGTFQHHTFRRFL